MKHAAIPVILVFSLFIFSCSEQELPLERAIQNHILFEKQDPTLMSNPPSDSLIYVGVVFNCSAVADTLWLIASSQPPISFDEEKYFIGTRMNNGVLELYAIKCPDNKAFRKRVDLWIPSDLDMNYLNYTNRLQNIRGTEHYYINISTYIIQNEKKLKLCSQRKKRIVW